MSLSLFSWRSPLCYFLWDLGSWRCMFWGWNCGLLCLSSYSKVVAMYYCSRWALYSQWTVCQPKLWPVKSWLTHCFFSSVERQLLYRSWFGVMYRCFWFLKGRHSLMSLNKPLKLSWLLLVLHFLGVSSPETHYLKIFLSVKSCWMYCFKSHIIWSLRSEN